MSFEIVQGDYGKTYRGVIEDENYTDHTAKFYLWDQDDTLLIDGKSCVITQSEDELDTYVNYTPLKGEFDDIAPGLYYGQFELSKTDHLEHTLKFSFEVHKRRPEE